jgi:hypothetical protein
MLALTINPRAGERDHWLTAILIWRDEVGQMERARAAVWPFTTTGLGAALPVMARAILALSPTT